MKTANLTEVDAANLVRLLGEVAEKPEPVHLRKSRLMQGLCELLAIDTWLWTLTEFKEDGDHTVLETLHGGLNEWQVLLFFAASHDMDQPIAELPGLRRFLQEKKAFTQRRQQLISNDDFYASKNTRTYRRALDCDQSLYSFFPLGAGLWSSIGLHRRWGCPPFSARDERLVHILLSGIGWLHRSGQPPDAVKGIAGLSPRLRSITGLLREGQRRKQIAACLGLSHYTVRDYMSQIYRHFGVRSQVELVRHLSINDGSDTGGRT